VEVAPACVCVAEDLRSCAAIGQARHHQAVWLVVIPVARALVVRDRLPAAAGSGTAAARLRWVGTGAVNAASAAATDTQWG
jgi:hypothetical protein